MKFVFRKSWPFRMQEKQNSSFCVHWRLKIPTREFKWETWLPFWTTSWEELFYAICEQQNRRSACASAQSDQHLSCILPRQNFKTLASFWSRAGRFESYLVAPQPKTGFLMTWLILPLSTEDGYFSLSLLYVSNWYSRTWHPHLWYNRTWHPRLWYNRTWHPHLWYNRTWHPHHTHISDKQNMTPTSLIQQNMTPTSLIQQNMTPTSLIQQNMTPTSLSLLSSCACAFEGSKTAPHYGHFSHEAARIFFSFSKF